MQFICLAILAVPLLSSCQTAIGVGRDLDHLGKTVFAPKHREATPVAHSESARTISLERLEPRVFRKGMFTQKKSSQPNASEDFATQAEVEEVLTSDMSSEGSTTVDLDGDGVADVRYRQRY
jgi:predicted small secreted protein